MDANFTPESLVDAIRTLFELNNFQVAGSTTIHGAQVDLIAESKTDPFAARIYIEATIEYVDNDKYAKDLTKLAMIRRKEPGSRCLIVSSDGFTDSVRERAKETDIETLRYSTLFEKFEKFETYVRSICGEETELSRELSQLSSVYEEPIFDDKIGKEPATKYLENWRSSATSANQWLVVVGEYGTGKTALTRVLQYRWLKEYKENPQLRIPLRIELRDFTRQFDARGLLHHFLDNNQLGHISVEFVFSLIKKRRVILLLDGYDEMAQYMHIRERRVCLEALANLASDGALGILTSRPNYFSEAEELRLFEILYSSVQNIVPRKRDDAYQTIVTEEKRIDDFLKSQILNRYERSLRDLSQDQTEALVGRILRSDPEGQHIVLSILRSVFRGTEGGSSISLSGKPVIIGYLIEVVEGLKKRDKESPIARLSEWQVYTLIIDQLMLRDWRRSQYIMPERRRGFLRALSLRLSSRDFPSINESQFKELIRSEFKVELRRVLEGDRENEVERYFSDLRSSTTLTITSDRSSRGWKFSHNSLREFLLTEMLIDHLERGKVVADQVPISEPMRHFMSSHSATIVEKWLEKLSGLWVERSAHHRIGQILSLLWQAAFRLSLSEQDPHGACLRRLTGDPVAMNDVSIDRVEFSTEDKPANLEKANFSSSTINDSSFVSANLRNADFSHAILENVNLSNADLRGSVFRGTLMVEVDVSRANLAGVDLRQLYSPPVLFVRESGSLLGRKIEGDDGIGYLRYAGALTNDVPPFFVYRHHPDFPIVEKICRKLTEQNWRQLRGLIQRGTASQKKKFAEAFILSLRSLNLLEVGSRRDLIRGTQRGREVFTRLCERNELAPELETFFKDNSP